jgi:pSer/pThr/pTyr-binding forkhead associated (FHA) protein
MHAQLLPLDGGPPIEVAKDLTLIGRQEDCDLRLDHKSVSKAHCILVKTDGLLFLRDLGSTNGTRVNGTRVRRAALLPNDKLSVANFHFRVLFGAALAALAQVDQTQRLDTGELNKGPSNPFAGADSEADQPLLDIQKNSLPDVYEEKKSK